MMKFLKEHSYNIIRLFLNQFALAVFGIILLLASTMQSDGTFSTFSLVVSIFSSLFYLYILYATLFEIGEKDQVKIQSGRLAYDRFHGLKLMLWAQSINFLILFLMFLGWLFAFIIKGSEPFTEFGLNMYVIMHTIFYFIQSMYQGIIGFIVGSGVSEFKDCTLLLVFDILTTIPAILVSWGSYILGTHGKKLFFMHPPKSDHP